MRTHGGGVVEEPLFLLEEILRMQLRGANLLGCEPEAPDADSCGEDGQLWGRRGEERALFLGEGGEKRKF